MGKTRTKGMPASLRGGEGESWSDPRNLCSLLAPEAEGMPPKFVLWDFSFWKGEKATVWFLSGSLSLL